MTIHIIKLCVGAESVEDLAEWQIGQLKRARKAAAKAIAPLQKQHPVCGTRMWPKRLEDVLAGGSLYWVIKGLVLCRQRLIGLEARRGADGIERCALLLDDAVIRTEPMPRRAFQGWRYLEAADSPRDLPTARKGDDRLPEPLALALAEIGLR